MEDQNRSELEMDLGHVDHTGRPIGSWLCCLPCYWLKRNSSFHNVFLTIATLLVTVLLVASPVIFLISSIPGDKSRDCQYQENECIQQGNEKVCLEEDCLTAANRILASMSWKTNPCQDFYNFACGSWKKKPDFLKSIKSKLQEDPYINFETLQQNVDQNIQQLLAVTANTDPFQKLGLFYKSCIRAGDKKISLLPMLSLLDELGGYVEPGEEPSKDVTDLVLSLLRLNGAPLFDIYLDSDPHNSSKLAPIIDLPLGFGHAFPSNYWWHRMEKNLMNEFRTQSILHYEMRRLMPAISINKAYNYIKASIEEKRLIVMEKIMQEFMSGNMTTEEKIKETQNTLLFANTITKVYPRQKDVMKYNEEEMNEKMKLVDLEKKYPFIRWQFILEEFLNVHLSSDDYVFVLVPAYLDNLQEILPRFSSRIVHNGLLLIFATDTLYELLNNSTYDWPAFCTKITVSVFSKAVSILYLRQYTSEYIDQLRHRVTQMFNLLKRTFEKRIRNVSWLDDKTRESVFRKLSALQGHFLRWPNFWNVTYATSLMEDVRVDPDNFFGNVIRRYRELRKVPVNYKQYQSDGQNHWVFPFVINAFYILTMNTIIIPLAVLTQPYFRENVPLYFPYSTVGLILAHEILHGFDLRGINYDSSGKPGSLMSAESRARFEARMDCFVKQFSSTFWKKVNFLGRNVDIQFDWNMTKNENMADISGLQMAYQAWKSVSGSESEVRLPGVTLNAQQLFFLNAAQTYCSLITPADYIFLVEMDLHTPHPERVNGIMMNSPGFAEAFKCPLGSPMNPRKKCSTW